MGLRSLIKKTTAALTVLAMTAGVGLLSYQHGIRQGQSKMEQLQEELDRLKGELRHLQYINDLAVEFGMDPFVVQIVDYYSRQYVDPASPEWRLVQTPEFMTYLMLSLIYAESKGNPKAVGDNGRARGLTQIWVSTAAQYGQVSAQDLLDPEINISYSFKHFHHLLQKYEGNVALALYAWNRGAGTVDRLLAYGQSPANGYGKKVYLAALDANRELLAGN